MEWLEALVLGLVQGLTEFLPVSSDGHLAITQQAFAHFTGRSRSGAENLFFDVMLHLGTLAAIVVYYRAVVGTSARGLLGSVAVPPAYRRLALVRTGLMAGIATLPLVPEALFLKKFLEEAFESSTATGVGFLITAAVLALTIALRGGPKGPAEMTAADALWIGIAQMFAPLPGVSRSGLTVAAGLALGLSRSWAVGFSLLIAVPAILGAAVFECRKVDPATLDSTRVAQTAAATVVAGMVGYGAIIWLVKIVRSGRLWYFSVYLVALASVVLGTVAVAGGAGNARSAAALDRPLWIGAAESRSRERGGRAGRRVDHAVAAGARPGAAVAGSAARVGGRGVVADLVLGRPLAGDW
jgi:undecaprenyl-diphosphatase